MAKIDLQAWLIKQKISVDSYNANELIQKFQDEMKKGLNGEKSSLAMIPSYFGIDKKVIKNKWVAVIDAGGTNLRIGKARFEDDGKIHLECLSTQGMPGRDKEKETKAEDFYKVLVDELEPFQKDFDYIGFCFSYPTEIFSNLDGKLKKLAKEIKIPDMVDTFVGEGLIRALEKRGIRGKQVVVLNDTVACLLAGLAQGQKFQASSYVGFILGTGTNTAYVEKNDNIQKKVDGNLVSGSSQVINVESGGFDLFDPQPVDHQVDKNSENSGSHLFEKAISGEYMGKITLELLQTLDAEKKDVFTEQGKETISNMKELSNEHLSNLAANNGKYTGSLGTLDADDREIVTTVYNAVVDRAAFFTAVNICAAVVKSEAGTDAKCPVCVNIDGSTYEKTFQMKEKVDRYLKEMLDARGLFIRYTEKNPDEDDASAPLVGAAIAGLTAFENS